MNLYRFNGKYFYGYFDGNGYFDSECISYVMDDFGTLIEIG